MPSARSSNLPRRILIKFRRLHSSLSLSLAATKTYRTRTASTRGTRVGNDARFEQPIGRNLALEPLRDWFPLSSYSAFTTVMDMLQGADAPWGWSSCNCHPNCGIFTLLVVNRKTSEMSSLFEFFNYEQFMQDVAVITDTARGKKLTIAQLGMAIMRNYNAAKAPDGFPDFADLNFSSLLRRTQIRIATTG